MFPLSQLRSLIVDVSINGVNFSIPGNGGSECLNFIPYWQRLAETFLLTPLGIYGIWSSIGHLEFPIENKEPISDQIKESNSKSNGVDVKPNSHPVNEKTTICKEAFQGKKLLTDNRRLFFNFYSTVFLIELCYKTVTKTGIFLLNPCHCTTLLQLILLYNTNDRNPWAIQLFRFQMYSVPGAVIAIVCPILNTRLLMGEVFIYFVQHILIVVTPMYLITFEGAYQPESLLNLHWPIFSYSVIFLYHFLFLQPIALKSGVNLNCIMCPGVSDPFNGRFWRLWAMVHQFLIIPVVTKIYAYLSFGYALIGQSYFLEFESKCDF